MTDVVGNQITVTTSPTLLVPPLPSAQVAVFHNKGAASVFIGPSNVAASGVNAGVEIATTEVFPQGAMELPPETAIYGIAASASQRVDVFRVVAD